ncbi:MAG: AAA family ATPase [Cloacibacillus sp.]
MRLSNVCVKNFRCFEDISLDLSGSLTILVGNNGAGKSALLDAIAIGLGAFTAGIKDLKANYNIDKNDARHVSYAAGGAVNTEAQYPVSVSCVGRVEHDKTTLKWTRSLNSSGGSTTVKGAREIIEYASRLTLNVMKNTGEHDVLPVFGYYGTGRLWAHKKAKWGAAGRKKTSRIDGYIDCLAAESNEKLMLEWFEKMTQKELQELQLNNGAAKLPIFEVVKSAVKQCVEKISDFQDSEIRYNLESQSLELISSASKNRQTYLLTELSDGYKSTISMIGDIAYRMAVLNPHLEEKALTAAPGVVLIDEVDLHLHPLWQQVILSDLTRIFPKVQFIVTTHAPSVIMSAKDAQIVVIEREDLHTPHYAVYGRDANSILCELMGASERPSEIKSLLNNFYTQVSEMKLEEAEAVLERIKTEIGADDPEIAKAETVLFFEKFENTDK